MQKGNIMEINLQDNRLKTNLCGIDIDNPIIPASGTFGYGYEFAKIYDINCLGTFSIKGTTLYPRYGNPLPRITESPSAILNSVGLQNPGIEKVLSHELRELDKVFHKKVIANVSGFSISEYVNVCEMLNDEDKVGWIELNISCPNVHGGGMSFGTSPELAGEVTASVRKVTSKPLILKLSPNVTDIKAIAKSCEANGADAISLINTLLGMRIDLKSRKPILKNRTGGISGPAIFPLALRMVYDVYEAVKIPVVGMGGISSARDVIEMMLAGARAVEIGSANLINPYASKEIINELPALMDEMKINNIEEIIGGAHE